MTALNLFQFEDTDQELISKEGDQVDEAFEAATAHPASVDVTPFQPESGTSGDERLEREALSFVAGYIAAKCRHLDAELGQPTHQAPPSSVPSSWIRAISRGGLTVPSPGWITIVEEFEIIFRLMVGATVDSQPGIVKTAGGAPGETPLSGRQDREEVGNDTDPPPDPQT